jgi:hypothetical protein
MESTFMCMDPLHWQTPVLGQQLSYVNGFMLWFASLSRADIRFGPISVGPFRNFLSKGCRSTNQSSDRFVSPVKWGSIFQILPRVGFGPLDSRFCRHRTGFGLFGKGILRRRLIRNSSWYLGHEPGMEACLHVCRYDCLRVIYPCLVGLFPYLDAR